MIDFICTFYKIQLSDYNGKILLKETSNMIRDIFVSFLNKNNEIEKLKIKTGTIVGDLLSDMHIPLENLYALKINNELCPLDTPIEVTSFVEPVLSDTKEGAAIYRRSLCFLLAAAANKLFPNIRLVVGHSLGHGYFYTFDKESTLTDAEFTLLQQEMRDLVKKDLQIKTTYISYEEATKLFEVYKLTETRKLMNFTGKAKIKINTIERFADLYFNALVPSTGILKTFEIKKYKEGFFLRFPKSSNPNELTKFVEEPKLYELYKTYKDWGKRLNVTSVASLNELICHQKINDFIDISETYQEKTISDIATQIYSSKKVRIVLIAGPSSSGKTTTSKKLGLELQAIGYTPKIISLDCYYKGREFTPLDENGEPDFECLEALDVDLLNQNLIDLFDGKEVTIPSYDFHSGKQFFDTKNNMILNKNEILIMEGIHGLNDQLTPKIPHEMKFKIYLSALTQLNLDDHNRISTSDNRLIRRIVRDFNFRGKSAAGTISMWQSVRNGEIKHIFPFQNNADAILNTAFDYELAVLRVYAAPLLRQINPTMKEYTEATRLLTFLENFVTVPSTAVPPRSILREFIGGSAFKY